MIFIGNDLDKYINYKEQNDFFPLILAINETEGQTTLNF
jgi:hypothetical protein